MKHHGSGLPFGEGAGHGTTIEVQSRGQSIKIDSFVNAQYPHMSILLPQLSSILTEMFPSMQATLFLTLLLLAAIVISNCEP